MTDITPIKLTDLQKSILLLWPSPASPSLSYADVAYKGKLGNSGIAARVLGALQDKGLVAWWGTRMSADLNETVRRWDTTEAGDRVVRQLLNS